MTAPSQTETDQEQLVRATQYFNSGDLAQAGLMAQTLFTKNSQNADALHLLGMIASRSERADLAVRLLKMAIDLQPQRPFFHFHLGELYGKQNQTAMAATHYRTAIQLKPDFVSAYINLGNICFGDGDQEAAIDAYLMAANLDPKADQALYNLGIIAQENGYHAEALQLFDQALRVAPQAAATHMARSFSLLMTGHFAEGWQAYEWRWHLPSHAPRICVQPRWDGSDPRGKRLYIYTEQGYGDALMFARYIALVRDRGGYVLLECKPELFRLLQSSNLADELVVRVPGDASPPAFEFDCHLPLLSLPGYFTTSLQTIPSNVPYLHVDPVLRAQWYERFQSLHGFRVAICWSGNPEASVNRNRACTLQMFWPLLQVPGISWLSVQKGPPVQQLRASQWGGNVLDLDSHLTDFAETAAVLANVDLLIATDTAVVHLAGGLGLPVWVILHTAAEWRWLQDRLDSPWYPGMRLFRQKTAGDWPDVLERVVVALEGVAEQKK